MLELHSFVRTSLSMPQRSTKEMVFSAVETANGVHVKTLIGVMFDTDELGYGFVKMLSEGYVENDQ